MQRFGFTACALLVGALVLVPPTMAKDTPLPTAGPDQLIELSGKPAHAEQRVERLAQTRDHRKRSPGAAVVAPPAAVVVKPPAAVVVKPPAVKGVTVRGGQLKARPGYVLEKGANNKILYRRIGDKLGASASIECLCDGKNSSGWSGCKTETIGPKAYCSETDFAKCMGTCDWKAGEDSLAPSNVRQ